MRKLLVLALGLAAFTACDDDDGVGPAPEGRVRVVHAISNVATADVLFGTTTVKAALAYKGAHGYADIDAGARTIKVRKAGAAADLVSVPQTIVQGKAYTIVAMGTEAAPQHLALTDDFTNPAANKAKLRVVHAAMGQGNVDVYVLEELDDLAAATAKAANIAPKAASAYVEVDAGTYVVVLTAAGTKTPVLTMNAVALTTGRVRTIVAVEKAGGGAPIEGVVFADKD